MKKMHKILLAALFLGTATIGTVIYSSQPQAEIAVESPQVTSEEGEECDFYAGDEDCPLTDEQLEALNIPHPIGSDVAEELSKIEIPQNSIFNTDW